MKARIPHFSIYCSLLFFTLYNTLYAWGSPISGPQSGNAFHASDGVFVMEAEHFQSNQTAPPYGWVANSTTAGASGGNAMMASPNSGLGYDIDAIANSPSLTYSLNFQQTGRFYVWVLAWASTSADNSFHTGLGGAPSSTADRIETKVYKQWAWVNRTMDSGVGAYLDITQSGAQSFSIWMREDGIIVDKILLTTDPNYLPSGMGPAESPFLPIDGGSPLQAPIVVRTLPVGQTSQVPIGSAFVLDSIFFPNASGQAIDPATVSANAVRLIADATLVAVGATLTLSANGRKITLQPTSALTAQTTYRLEVTDQLKDLAGAGFAPFSTTFTTETVSEPNPPLGYQQDAQGFLVMEAEKGSIGATINSQKWEMSTSPSGFAGTGALVVLPNLGSTITLNIEANSPSFTIPAQFQKTGKFYVWLRVLAINSADNSIHVGMDGSVFSTSDKIEIKTYNQWVWANVTMDASARAFLDIAQTGSHQIQVWMREDGMYVDRVLLTDDANFTPVGAGPAESAWMENAAQFGVTPTQWSVQDIAGDNTPSGTQLFTVQNTGNQTLTGISVQLSDPTSFQLHTANLATMLAPGQSTSFGIAFNPATVGQKLATAIVATTQAAAVHIALSGEGLSATASNAIIAVQNLTRITGTTNSFPSDQLFVFQDIVKPTYSAKYWHQTNVMRVWNNGTDPMTVTNLVFSAPDYFRVTHLNGNAINQLSDVLPLGIAPGQYADLTLKYSEDSATVRAVRKETLHIYSNASNTGSLAVQLNAGVMLLTEGNNEFSVPEIASLFNINTNTLYLGKTRLSSNYPQTADVDAGKHGDLIVSPYFKALDPNKSITAVQLAGLQGPNGSASYMGSRFLYNYSPDWHQSLYPRNTTSPENIASKSFKTSLSFELKTAGYSTLGSGGIDSLTGLPKLLGVRVFKAKDANGVPIPGHYFFIQDFIGANGCGSGGGNCDFNDNVHYFTNIRPAIDPTLKTAVADYFVVPNGAVNHPVAQAFDKGYAGNRLAFSATLANGAALPNWLLLNATTGTFTGSSPNSALSLSIVVTATDLNLLTVKDTFQLEVTNTPPSNARLAVNQWAAPTTQVAAWTLDAYPNPSTGLVHISASSAVGNTALIEVLGMDGKRCFSQSIHQSSFDHSVDLSAFGPGLYLLRVSSEQGSLTKKIFIE